MNENIQKLTEVQEEKVVGGKEITNVNINNKWNRDPKSEICCKKREEWKSDDNKKEQIRKMCQAFDSTEAQNSAIGECPGCGCLVPSIGDVCEECRKQANSQIL